MLFFPGQVRGRFKAEILFGQNTSLTLAHTLFINHRLGLRISMRAQYIFFHSVIKSIKDIFLLCSNIVLLAMQVQPSQNFIVDFNPK